MTPDTQQIGGDEFLEHEFEEVFKRLVRDDADTHIPNTGHIPLNLQGQAINQHMRMRIAGCDEEGRELGEEETNRDIAIIDMLHAPQVVVASRVQLDIEKYRAALSVAGGDYLDLDPKDISFMNDGGHWPSEHLPKLLSDIVGGVREKTYALLIEYVDKNDADGPVRVPFAYHFGFTELPCGDTRFPNLEASDIAGSNGEIMAVKHQEVWAPWRVGVIDALTPNVAQKMSDIGIRVPDYLIGVSGRRRGLNTLFKPTYGQAAVDLGKEWIVYNTAVVHPPNEPAVKIENTALRHSNADLFVDFGTRNHFDKLCDDEGNVVAQAVWDVFAQKPSILLDRSTRDEGTIHSKGGLDINQAIDQGHILAEVIRRRQKGS